MSMVLRRLEWLLGTYEPCPTIFPLHFGGFSLFTLDFGGRVAYMGIHHYKTITLKH